MMSMIVIKKLQYCSIMQFTIYHNSHHDKMTLKIIDYET
jgi:hypothetical protein